MAFLSSFALSLIGLSQVAVAQNATSFPNSTASQTAAPTVTNFELSVDGTLLARHRPEFNKIQLPFTFHSFFIMSPVFVVL